VAQRLRQSAVAPAQVGGAMLCVAAVAWCAVEFTTSLHVSLSHGLFSKTSPAHVRLPCCRPCLPLICALLQWSTLMLLCARQW